MIMTIPKADCSVGGRLTLAALQMAVEDICVEYEGHQVPVPYEAINMIVVAKETSGQPHEAKPTFTDDYIARILKYWPPDKESSTRYDYRVIMEKKAVQQIYQVIQGQGGLWHTFPKKKPMAAVTVLADIVNTIHRMHMWRGLEKREQDAIKEMNTRWGQAFDEEIANYEESERVTVSDKRTTQVGSSSAIAYCPSKKRKRTQPYA